MLRPSSLPALAECPCFESGGSNFEGGIDRHAALNAYFNGDETFLNLLEDEDREGVLWAADYIRVHANTGEHPLIWETKGEVILDDYTIIAGTPDAVCQFDIFDLKWRHAGYEQQMAAYAAMILQALPDAKGVEIRVHLLYGCFKRAEVLKFTLESALAIIAPIAKAHQDPDKQPNPCSYCGWCAQRLTCSALNTRAQTVAAGRDDWKLETYHASEITQPDQMAKALALARRLTQWAEAVNHFAKEMAVKSGVTIPGYELKSKAGKASCADVTGAFNALHIAPEAFLQCCEVRMSTSKTNPDKRGLADVLKEKKGISRAAAIRELKSTLEPFMRTPKEVLYLKAINEEEETETTNA